MNIQISGDTSAYTEITIKSATGDLVFDGSLSLEPDWWVLRDTRKDYLGDVVARWAGRREHLAVLADALKTISKKS